MKKVENGKTSLADLCARSLATASQRVVAVSTKHIRGPIEWDTSYV